MFSAIKGNARGCLIYEPLFLLPFNLYLTYASVYMLDLGVSERGIGWITSLGLVLQIFTSMISGYLTDRMGRKSALLVFDLLSWSVATIFWIFAQNIWFFIIAIVFNSLQKIPNTAWYCLLVEDTDPKDRHTVFTVLQLIGVIGGLFAPLGGLMVSHWTLVPAVRIMYIIAFFSMTVMFIGRNYATYETTIGLRKKADYEIMHWSSMLKEYGTVLRMIVSNRPLMLIFSIYILFQFQATLKNTFLSIYLIQHLHFRDSFIATFPAVTSAATLALMIFISPRLNRDRLNQYMIAGFIISAAATVIQIAVPAGQYAPIIISAVLSAVGSILTYPFLEAAVANTIDNESRAGMLSILSVLILVFISPAGVIGGWTYSLDPNLPFVVVIVSFLASAGMMLFYKTQVARPY